ncbi:MAG: acyltransferase [Parvibaculum sp.]|nr:acyltransferase [Parvibaculum sp.]
MERKKTLNSVQALRAFAAVSVMVGHLLGEIRQSEGVQLDIVGYPWGSGVDVFFVISGFIMMYTNYNEFGVKGAPLRFLVRRIIRVVPLYYIFTSMLIGVIIFMPHILDTARFDIWQFLSSYLFWPYERYDGEIRPILSLGWTLNFEMFFYALFAIALNVRRWVGVSALLLTMISLVILKLSLNIDLLPFRFWFSSIILEFCFGLVIGYGFYRIGKITLGKWIRFIPYLLPIAAFAVFDAPNPNSGYPRFICWGIPAALLVATFVFFLSWEREEKLSRLLLALGDSSFALYLSHPFSYNIIVLIWALFLPVRGAWAFGLFAVSLVFCLVVAHLVCVLVEKPTLKYLQEMQKGWSRRKRGTAKNAVD